MDVTMMVEQVTKDTPQDDAARWYEIDPWGGAPEIASKLPGLGGAEPSADPSYVLGTEAIQVSPGSFRMRIAFDGGAASDAAFLIEVTNRSDLDGSAAIRMRLGIAKMTAVCDAGGYYDIVIEAGPNTRYALNAYLHDDRDLGIRGLRVFVDRPFALVELAQDAPNAAAAAIASTPAFRNTVRLTGGEPPSFTNPYSQAWTPSQESEPAFISRCGDLGITRADTGIDAWSEAIALQALGKYGALAPGSCGIGFDSAKQALGAALIRRNIPVMLTRFAERDVETDLGTELSMLCTDAMDMTTFLARASYTTIPPCSLPAGYSQRFDFAWWIAREDATSISLAGQLNAMLTSLRQGGIGILVVPFDAGRAFALGLSTEHVIHPARHAIERLALEAVAQGHSVAQLRFGPAIEADVSVSSRFCLIVARN